MMGDGRMSDKQEWIAEGFSFENMKDARLASEERKKIAYLESRMSQAKPEEVLVIYEKAIQDRVFKTPVGIIYLRELQSFLLGAEEIENDRIPPIPIYVSFEGTIREQTAPAKIRVKPAQQQKTVQLLPLSLIGNALLVIAVIAMFVITLMSDVPNILNYENALLNKYSTWEQELTEREQTIRGKEREMKIEE